MVGKLTSLRQQMEKKEKEIGSKVISKRVKIAGFQLLCFQTFPKN